MGRYKQTGPTYPVREVTLADWKWTARRELAAVLAAEDLPNLQVAERVGVSLMTYMLWRRRDEFRERVAELRRRRADAVADISIANVRDQVAAADDRWRRMKLVMEQRGADPDMQSVPGGRSGFIARSYRAFPSGQVNVPPTIVEEYKVDTGFLSAFVELEAHVAKLLGLFAPAKVDVEHRVRELAAQYGLDEDEAEQALKEVRMILAGR